LWSADARGGVVHIRPDGSQHLITQQVTTRFSQAESEEERYTTGTLPNGLAFPQTATSSSQISAPTGWRS
jgi:gluconolactonase